MKKPQPWFRFYVSALSDPKVLSLDYRARWFWIECLALAHDNSGELPSIPIISKVLRVRLDHASSLLDTMSKIGLIDTIAKFVELELEGHNGGWSVMNAPTNEAWIDHWEKHLVEKGLNLYKNHGLSEIIYDKNNNKINACLIKW